MPHGSVRATVLIETILAAFEMDEILFELREHAAGLNAGSLGLHLQHHQEVPDAGRHGPARPTPGHDDRPLHARLHRAARADLPSPRCARDRWDGGLHSVSPRSGGQRAGARSVRADKERESGDGFDGTWVAHPDLVPVAREVFDGVLGSRPNQKDRQRPEVRVTVRRLLDVSVPGAPCHRGGGPGQRLDRARPISPRGWPGTARRRSTT